MAKKFIEVRKRGFFGYVTLTIFWIANGFMGLWLAGVIMHWSDVTSKTMSEAERIGTDAGMTIGLGILFSIWTCVALVTGLLVLMTRGRKEITEVEV